MEEFSVKDNIFVSKHMLAFTPSSVFILIIAYFWTILKCFPSEKMSSEKNYVFPIKYLTAFHN